MAQDETRTDHGGAPAPNVGGHFGLHYSPEDPAFDDEPAVTGGHFRGIHDAARFDFQLTGDHFAPLDAGIHFGTAPENPSVSQTVDPMPSAHARPSSPTPVHQSHTVTAPVTPKPIAFAAASVIPKPIADALAAVIEKPVVTQPKPVAVAPARVTAKPVVAPPKPVAVAPASVIAKPVVAPPKPVAVAPVKVAPASPAPRQVATKPLPVAPVRPQKPVAKIRRPDATKPQPSVPSPFAFESRMAGLLRTWAQPAVTPRVTHNSRAELAQSPIELWREPKGHFNVDLSPLVEHLPNIGDHIPNLVEHLPNIAEHLPNPALAGAGLMLAGITLAGIVSSPVAAAIHHDKAVATNIAAISPISANVPASFAAFGAETAVIPVTTTTTAAPTTTTTTAAPTTTSTVKEAPVTNAAVPANTSQCSTSRAAAEQCWGPLIDQYSWNQQYAFNVMWCESTGNPNARNPNSTATGLFQILNGPTDPAANVALAFKMYSQRGWEPWVCKG